MLKEIFILKKNIREEEEILINILTRTSNRPIGFQNCRQSIIEQTYKNVKHLVSYENEVDLAYIKDNNIVKVKVEKYNGDLLMNTNGYMHAPYNLYCNELMNNVTNGWILFLDDDDNLLHNKVLKEIVSEIKKADENTIFIWQMRYPNGKILPLKKHFDEERIEINNIDTTCFIFHSKFKDYARWDEWKVSDFRFISALYKEIPKNKWIQKVYIQINNYGDLGRRNDIAPTIINNKIFHKTFFWFLIPKYHFKIFDIYIFHKNTYSILIKNIFRIMFKYFNKITLILFKK